MGARIYDIFDDMPEHVREEFVRRAQVRSFKPGALIYFQGDPGQSMFRIVKGEVRLSFSRSDGRELYYVFFGAGDCFGESNFVDGGCRPQTALATTDLELQVLTVDAMTCMAEAQPSFNRAVMKLLSHHMRLLIDLFADASLNDLAERVARRIIDATLPQGDQRRCGQLSINLSQTDIAHMVGASRQSVNKVLQRFQDEHLIRTEYGRLVVEAPDLLRQWAYRDGLSQV